jgi:hypothetical protein
MQTKGGASMSKRVFVQVTADFDIVGVSGALDYLE